MNIVFIITRADAIGGATVHVRDLARGLKQLGHRTLVLIGGKGEVLDEFARYGVEYQSLQWLGRAIHPWRDLLAFLELRRILKRLQPDLVCTHTAKAGLLGRAAAYTLGIPALYTPHGWAITGRISRVQGRAFRILERLAGPLSSSIINVCNAERDLARRYRIAPDDKLAVIYNGVSDVSAELRAQPRVTPLHVVMVARFESPKDHTTVLTAAAMLKDLSWTLEFVGNGPGLPAIRAQAEVLGLSERVCFTGAGEDVALRLSQSQLFVLSSRSEGFPLSILEAMRAGLPVIASDVGGVRESVIDGETGFVVPSENPPALARALRLLLRDSALREQLGSAGRRRFEAHFTIQQMLAQTVALYDSLLANRRGETSLLEETAGGR